jgi:hypothetical protein
MPRKARKTQKQFGASAGALEIGKYGSFAAGAPSYTTDPAVIQSLVQYDQGWVGASQGDAPAVEDRNALDFLFAYQLFYLMQAGIPEWDAGTTYYTGNVVSVGNQYGFQYVSLADDNLNHAVTDTLYWRKIDGQITATKTSSFTLTAAENGCIIPCNTTGGAFTITLPTGGAAKNFKFTIKDVTGTFDTNAVTIARIGSEKIENVAANFACKVEYGSYTFVTDGTDWYIVSQNIAVDPTSGRAMLGPVSTAPSTSGPAHVVNGSLNAGGTGTADDQRGIIINANAYHASYANGLNPRQTGIGGGFIQLHARGDNTVDAISMWTNKVADGATTNAGIVASCTQNGAWAWGPSVANSSTGGQAHVVTGGISAGGTSSTDDTRGIILNCNGYQASYSAGLRPRSTGIGGSFLQLHSRTDNSFDAIAFYTNKVADGATTNGTLIAYATQAGAWTFGNSNLDVSHGVINSRSDYNTTFYNYQASPFGIKITYPSASPNSVGNEFFACTDNSTSRLIIRSNGGIANYSANNVNLSDARLKNILGPTPSMLEKICDLEVTDFEYKDSPGNKVTGLIAQQVETVLPELINEGGNAVDENGEQFTAKAIRTTDLYHMMLKAIQELKTENDALRKRVENLEARIEIV